MIKISSRAVWFQKRVFPVVWFGGLGVFSFFALFADTMSGENSGPPPLFAIFPIGMAIAGIFFMKKTVWLLMDEVYDAGDDLVVRNRGEEDRIALSEIVNITVTPGKSTFVTLRLRHACRFGSEIAFLPESSFSFNPFARNPIVEDLITRVDRARMTARRS
jgi:hypothetical protein